MGECYNAIPAAKEFRAHLITNSASNIHLGNKYVYQPRIRGAQLGINIIAPVEKNLDSLSMVLVDGAFGARRVIHFRH